MEDNEEYFKQSADLFDYWGDHYKATTLWETLPVTDDYPDAYRGSHSHPMQAGFNAWFYSGIAGINPGSMEPGVEGD